MARPGLHKHPKFKRLVKLLGEPVSHARGYLEMLWEVGYENGDPFIGDGTDVELACEYPGPPGKLLKSLMECGPVDDQGHRSAGFVEQCPDRLGTYQIHDLLDHAPDYVRKRARRESERKNKNLRDDLSAERRSVAAISGQPDQVGRTPAPAPAPAPAHPKTPSQSATAKSLVGGDRASEVASGDGEEPSPKTPAIPASNPASGRDTAGDDPWAGPDPVGEQPDRAWDDKGDELDRRIRHAIRDARFLTYSPKTHAEFRKIAEAVGNFDEALRLIAEAAQAKGVISPTAVAMSRLGKAQAAEMSGTPRRGHGPPRPTGPQPNVTIVDLRPPPRRAKP